MVGRPCKRQTTVVELTNHFAYAYIVNNNTVANVTSGEISLFVHMVCIFKKDAVIRKDFPVCVCGPASPHTGRLLPAIGRLFHKLEGERLCAKNAVH